MEYVENKPKKRLAFLDVAKFLTMMVVIPGHRITKRLFRMFTNSFPVPMFFAISGYTFKFSPDWRTFFKRTLKRFIRLMIAYYVTVFAMFVVDLILAKGSLPKSYWVQEVYKIFGIMNTGVAEVLALWFLFALFTGSMLFDALHLVFGDSANFGVACLTSTIIGTVLGLVLDLTPFYFDLTLSIQVFMFLGYKLKNVDFNKANIWHILLFLSVWIGTMLIMWFSEDRGGYMAIANRRFTLFPLCYICGSAATVLFLILCFKACKYMPKIMKPFAFLGRYTIYMVCIHTFAFYYFDKWFAYTSNKYINNLIYFGIGSAIFFVILACDLIIHHSIKKKKEQQAAIA